MTRYVTLSVLILPLIISAQPVIDASSITPPIGQSVFVNIGGILPVPPGGAFAVWDFSSLQFAAVTEVAVSDAQTSALADLFPSATLLTSNAISQSSQFYEITNSFVDIWGVLSISSQTLLNFSDPRRDLVFPCTIGTQWSDGFSGAIEVVDQVIGTRTGTIVGEADGFGTLILPLPIGELTNVLRVHLEEDNTDVNDSGSSTTNGDRYVYYKPGVGLPILETIDFTITNANGTSTERRSQWLTAVASEVNEYNGNVIGISAFPNPTVDQITLTMGIQSNSRVDMLDATGRVVNSQFVPCSAPGIHTVILDLNTLVDGMYMARVTDEQGQQGMIAVVKN